MSNDFLKTIRPLTDDAVSPSPLADLNPLRLGLCAALMPVWGRQLATSRKQSEAAVVEMMSAFAEIGPHLDQAARQCHQITAALSHDAGSVTNLAQACTLELQPLIDQSSPALALALQKVMGMVQKSVDDLEGLARPFEQETQLVSQQIERMYVGFQYQDRISQMMGLLQDDMARLASALADPLATPDALVPEAWLARLAAQYVMQDQRQDHAAKSDSLAGESLDTTFF